MYYFNYHIVGSDDILVIATTRPETMFADQAIFVHPDDERYKKYVGMKAITLLMVMNYQLWLIAILILILVLLL